MHSSENLSPMDALSGEVAGSDPKRLGRDPSGVWAARLVTCSVALGLEQLASNWYFCEFAQSGAALMVVDHMDCGLEVDGTPRVSPRTGAALALNEHNSQVGRRGGVTRTDEHGTFDMARFWHVRGVSEQRFLTTPFGAKSAVLGFGT